MDLVMREFLPQTTMCVAGGVGLCVWLGNPFGKEFKFCFGHLHMFIITVIETHCIK